MKVLKVYPKDLYVTLEISFSNLKKLVKGLDVATLTYDGEANPDIKEAALYVTGEFFEELKDIVAAVEGM
jgi:hypothetical protein